jgi:mRNA degradation ribonuclease J1/J2
MLLTIHRGAKEIGGSCVEIQSGGTRILIDFGIPLVNQNGDRFDSKSQTGKSVEDLQKFAKTLKPKYIIPNHTFYPKEYGSLFGDNVKIVNDDEPFMI